MAISFGSPSSRDARARGAGVTAVLGPTNTGKTHLAIERMLAHSSGMIGLPLRLLAREVYNKCVERVGAEQVALVTGEEKIMPASPRYWVSTLERCRAISTCRSWRSTKFNWAPISSADMSSPTVCSTGAAATRRWCLARPRCAIWWRSCFPARTSCRARAFPRCISQARRNSRACRAAPRSSRSRPTKSTRSPN